MPNVKEHEPPLKRTNEPLPHPATTKAKAPTITVYQTTRTPPPPHTDDHQLSSKSPPPPTARRGVAKGAKLRLLCHAGRGYHMSRGRRRVASARVTCRRPRPRDMWDGRLCSTISARKQRRVNVPTHHSLDPSLNPTKTQIPPNVKLIKVKVITFSSFPPIYNNM